MGISRDYGMRVDSLGEGVGDELIMQLNAACKQFEAGYDPNTNLRALATYHAPKHLAKKILESL